MFNLRNRGFRTGGYRIYFQQDSTQTISSDLVLRPDGQGWEKSGLITDSVVRLHKIVTIQKNMIRRRIGRLDEDSSAVVRMKLNTLFD